MDQPGTPNCFSCLGMVIEDFAGEKPTSCILFLEVRTVKRYGGGLDLPDLALLISSACFEIRPQLTHVFQGPSICLLARP